MTKKKSTKRALLLSAISLLMCVSMFVGSTFAWFTDSVNTTLNKIQSGNLDVDLLYWDMSMGAGAKFISLGENPDTKLFKNVDGEEILWEPNASGFGQFTVENKGSLALKYELKLNFANATATPTGKTLADVLTVYAIARRAEKGEDGKMEDAKLEDLITNGMDSLIEGYEDVALKDFILTGYLLPGESFTYELGVNWNQSENDNEFNVKGGLSMDFGVTLLATQMTYEKDADGDQYDKDAVYDDVAYSATDLATLLTANEKKIEVILGNNVELPITSLGSITAGSGEYKLGGADTEEIVIDLGGKKLDITTTYWSALGAVNPDATITIKNGTLTSTGNSAGTWNAWNVRLCNCNYVLENVTFEKAVALDNAGKSVTMKNVTINETSGDKYALWITSEGQNVTIDGLTVYCPEGRGIKIDNQYVDNSTLVNLSVANATFTTAKKAAIIVKSPAGANIALDNVDITNVAEDPLHEVWVDEDAAGYADLVTVTGGEKIVEGTVVIIKEAEKLTAAVAKENTTVILGSGDFGKLTEIAEGVTIIGNGETTFATNENALPTALNNVTFKNVNLSGANVLSNGTATGDVTFENCTISGNTYGIHFDSGIGENNIVFKNCKITGYTTFAASIESVVFENCQFINEAIDPSGATQVNIWGGEATFKNCHFDEFFWMIFVPGDATINIDNVTYDGDINDFFYQSASANVNWNFVGTSYTVVKR